MSPPGTSPQRSSKAWGRTLYPLDSQSEPPTGSPPTGSPHAVRPGEHIHAGGRREGALSAAHAGIPTASAGLAAPAPLGSFSAGCNLYLSTITATTAVQLLYFKKKIVFKRQQ